MAERGSIEWKEKISRSRRGKRGGVFIGDLNPTKRPEVRKKMSDVMKNLWTQEPYRTKWLDASKKLKSKTPLEHFRMMGKRSRLHENQVASKLEGLIFQPNEVCDRIVVRDGQVFFIEIKKNGKKLSEKQELFASIVGDKFQVLYS